MPYFTSYVLVFASSLLLLSACQSTSAPVQTPPPVEEPEPQPSELSVTLSASVTEGEAPLTVAFEAEADGYTPDFIWEFGDGSEILFSEPEQTHTYREAGRYTASVSVGGSEDLVSDTVTITVRE